MDAAMLNEAGRDYLPGLVGLEVLASEEAAS